MSSSLLFGLSSISFIMMFPSSLSSALDPPVALSVEGELVLSVEGELVLSSALDPPVALSVEGELVLSVEGELVLSPPSSLLLLLLLSPLLLLLLLLALLALPIRCVISSALGILSSSLGWATAPPMGMPITTAPVASRSAINAGA